MPAKIYLFTFNSNWMKIIVNSLKCIFVVSFHFISFHFISFHFISFHFMFCFVLFCFVLFCFVLFCSVFCFVLFCFVLFLFCFVCFVLFLLWEDVDFKWNRLLRQSLCLHRNCIGLLIDWRLDHLEYLWMVTYALGSLDEKQNKSKLELELVVPVTSLFKL